ncbi:hypothetical protein MCOR25_004583 [Pyricularia grisea]|uniref:lytic cellulose monooxygenase (C4-dehydrogenating) n=1 Tax=Pyricularia grisea TaxID=148305 RepID=A0A6P8B3I5_PYRGI|nr:hypothetical protein PgNI_05658 [Pyricularia grisea]KAI6368840.1 hypothetical protein MCOR25_004583 [Pyricularia grisea]TLD09906.1 hypothetical protein PgNI_05658 [Pyricularia grisea]
MKVTAIILAASAAVNAHYVFPTLLVNGQTAGSTDWSQVRKTVSWQDNGFVASVTSPQIRCNQLNLNQGGSATATVAAGSKVGFNVAPSIYHPGPLAFYLAKVPAGQTAASWDGSGQEWFKIYHEQPNFGSQLTWPSMNLNKAEVTLPSCIPSGDYLLRVEHIALHSGPGQAQFYIACAQITVTGGGNTNPTNKVAFPGAYSPNDPGLMVNINWPIPTSYQNPGPPVFKC